MDLNLRLLLNRGEGQPQGGSRALGLECLAPGPYPAPSQAFVSIWLQA